MKIQRKEREISKRSKSIFILITSLVILCVYSLYMVFVLNIGSGPIDYETFMKIGQNLIDGNQIYTENSYYPMSYVGIFALFSLLPIQISFPIWVFTPVFFALSFSGWSPLILLFSPLFGHFVAGQTAFFGMLGLWGYRKNQKSKWAGVWLSLLLLKPQLAIAPLGWVTYKWTKQFISEKKIPDQFFVFIISTLMIFLPWFFYKPTWISEWLTNPRNIRLRAMAGILPRTIAYFNLRPVFFWLLVIFITIFLIYWMHNKKILSFDGIILLSFIVLPFLHDYDLIQIIPLLDNFKKQVWAFLSSVPLWFTIFFAYNNDHAWFTATLISPILLYLHYKERNM
jgi:hypothetical protein